MCGIYASISTRGLQIPSHALKHSLCNRGPDHTGSAQTNFTASDGTPYCLSFLSTVLALRGDHITAQPFDGSAIINAPGPNPGSILCWNGEAWKVGGELVNGNDGQVIYDILVKAVSTAASASDATLAVLKVLRGISGPFAFVFWDNVHGTLYCGRDRLGRRSLLYNVDNKSENMGQSEYIEFASTADPAKGNWKEIEADGIYIFSCNDKTSLSFSKPDSLDLSISTSPLPYQRFEWEEDSEADASAPSLGKFNRTFEDGTHILNLDSPSVMSLRHHLYLIHPHNTEMDLSIAFALYFASRGIGLASTKDDIEEILYTTPARVLLSGLGADELFGGYIRHATAFNRSGFSALLDELELDVNRLGKRNLGRDDRVISYWGREARFPYLDEDLVKWAVESPIWDKCGFTSGSQGPETPDIEPGKKVLRLLAYDLGMKSVAIEKKRAIQFGARTAKMEIGRTKGTTLIS
ncbi:hypothetical protein SS1G_06604 [Sclerotinia sclerotiorum 1980 UF-70]|uniref:Glutamine amidotransferase type-2 domain-containing protein n=1 Tax=Sclerotinia sclerotiorum (strain ATCC 18683 / 1980 / Ss-1) TaxID=665079 RepID=A7EMQ5_SCLS1|nr:hypothetical protein SS1G_06604 [Sclerotinia sclerotiorum 1980 UF-70]EDO04121.1 hypothetical protein SS1G_06604 [Sclerotinia sclerotiorum 1980 UF-70]